MAKKTKTDFTILKADFNAAVKALGENVNALLSKKNRSAEENTRLNKALKDFLRAVDNMNRQSAVLGALFNAADTGDIRTLKQAFAQGIDVNFLNRGGNSLLAFAVGSDEKKTVDFLISAGADVNLKKGSGFSPIEMAVIKDNAVLFKKLVAAGAGFGNLEALAQKNEAGKILKLLANKKSLKKLKRGPAL